MSSFSDISQISDILSISWISRANTSRIIGRIDSAQTVLDYPNSIHHNASKSTGNLNQGISHLEKTGKYFSLCEDSISEYAKSKMIFSCLNDASMNSKRTFSRDFANKLRGLLLIYELKKYMYLPTISKKVHETLSILGITDLPKYELSYEDKLDLKRCIETMLRERIQKFILSYEGLGGSMKEILRTNDYGTRKKLFDSHEMQLFQWKYRIEELCVQYETNVLKYKSLMNKWNKLKYEDLAKMNLEMAEFLLLQAQVAEVQAKITKLSCTTRLFMETPVTLDAFKILNTNVDEKLFATLSEITQKEDLKQQYENLRNTEYDEVLKTYLHYCKAIHKKKQILQKL